MKKNKLLFAGLMMLFKTKQKGKISSKGWNGNPRIIKNQSSYNWSKYAHHNGGNLFLRGNKALKNNTRKLNKTKTRHKSSCDVSLEFSIKLER